MNTLQFYVLSALTALCAGFVLPGGLVSPARATTFTDVTSEAGISFLHTGPPGTEDKFQGTGAAWFDFDRDGDLDLYVTQRIGANTLYRNDNGTFVNVTNLFGVGDSQHDGSGVSIADYNNDGYLDLYLANSDGDVLFRNDRGVAFIDVTSLAGIDVMGDGRGTTASWGDYDNDGHLDLYVSNHVPYDGTAGMQRDYLMHNNGDGTFTDVSHYFADTDRFGWGFVGAWTDIDDDGDLDILLINDCPAGPPPGMRLFRNDGSDGAGGWVFTEASDMWTWNRCDAGMGVAIGDYDRDGRLDYFYTNIGNPILLHNDGGAFSVRTEQVGISVGVLPGLVRPRWTWGANFFDYDLDGWIDLYVASGGFRPPSSVEPQANLLFHNEGDGTFRDVSAESGADDIDRTRTSIFGDYDGDGDPDLFIVNYIEPARLFRNDVDNGNHYLHVRLEGVVSNRDGIGARLRLRTADGAYQYNETHSGTSLGGGDDLAAYFGLGSHVRAEELLIRWPSGIVQQLLGVDADQKLRVVEDVNAQVAQIGTLSGTGGILNAQFTWRMNYERDAVNFEIQRRSGATFFTVEVVTAFGTTLRPTEYTCRVGSLDAGNHTFRVCVVDSSGAVEDSAPVTVSVRPLSEAFSPAFPNPFFASTRFELAVDVTQRVHIEAYDVAGRRVAVLFDGTVRPGQTPPITFEGSGRVSGIYLIKATGESFTAERKVLLLR
ncbi:MAG: CRTAC1 family protein [Candidatus Krumholzibacteriota bacterium]|nr:CRTAC1 family protein [Candidatus Krumholzibacteriota bacterium]